MCKLSSSCLTINSALAGLVPAIYDGGTKADRENEPQAGVAKSEGAGVAKSEGAGARLSFRAQARSPGSCPLLHEEIVEKLKCMKSTDPPWILQTKQQKKLTDN